MALKKVTRGNGATSVFNNSTTYYKEDKVEEVMQNGENGSPLNNSATAIGDITPISDLELEIKPEVTIEEGEYKFSIYNLKIDRGVETIFGIKDKIVIEFHVNKIENGELRTHSLKQKYNISNSKKSNFYKLYNGLMGRPPIGKINLKTLLGISGTCEVKYVNMDNGEIFPKIISLKPEIYNVPND